MNWEGLHPPYSTIVADPPWPYKDGPLGDFNGGRLARFLPYSVMELSDIEALPVSSLAAPAAHLYLWTTQRFLWEARQVAVSWGWHIAKVLTWCKEPVGHGQGGSFANTTEFLLFGRLPVGHLIRQARLAAGMSQGELEQVTRGRATRLSKRWEDDDCYPTATDWERLKSVLPLLADQPSLAPDPQLCATSWFQWPRAAHSVKPAASCDLIESVSPGPYVELFARQPRLGWDSWGFGYEVESVG